MTLLLTLGLCIAAIAIVAIVAIRILLKKNSNELSFRVESITPFQANHESRNTKTRKRTLF